MLQYAVDGVAVMAWKAVSVQKKSCFRRKGQTSATLSFRIDRNSRTDATRHLSPAPMLMSSRVISSGECFCICRHTSRTLNVVSCTKPSQRPLPYTPTSTHEYLTASHRDTITFLGKKLSKAEPHFCSVGKYRLAEPAVHQVPVSPRAR